MSIKPTRHKGFTIVELIVVIVVIGILAAIGYVSYQGVQQRAREAEISSDLSTLEEAIELARVRQKKILMDITGSAWTAQYCMFQSSNPALQIPNGTDFSVQNSMTQACWNAYSSALNAISTASGNDVTDLKDPWGRPYYIDENDTGGTECFYDALGWLSHPYIGGYNQHWSTEFQIPTRRASCNT